MTAFFKGKADPGKLAGNTLIALRAHGIISAGGADLTDFGKQLVGSLSLVRQAFQDGGLGQASPCSQRVESSIEAGRGPEAEWLGLSHRYSVAQVVHSIVKG